MKTDETKPPLGLEPRDYHDRMRSLSIIAAMERYAEAGKKIPMQWIDELRDLQLF